MADKNIKARAGASYKTALRDLQILLVTVQRHLIKHNHRALVIFEGRDAAGKDGTIKRITEHLSPRETRVFAPNKPSDRELGQWYFQRFVPMLPGAGEFVLFNRSWYNRAGVEHVMDFCSDDEYQTFLHGVIAFERMLVESGIQLIKYYLDISHDEQKKRLADRAQDPLNQWKISPIDSSALKLWKEYSDARDAMLKHTHHELAPWIVVSADNKKRARLNVIRDLCQRMECPERTAEWAQPDPKIIFEYSPRRSKRLAP